MADRDPLHIVGQLLADKYRIEALVGEGGFAVVYRATHEIWKKTVAIKFFNGLSSAPSDQRDELASAFVQEGALLTELSTETVNIVQARDVGTFTTNDGQWVPYMVLEWLDGQALDELLLREREMGRLPWGLPDALAFMGQVASALDVAHGKGVAHRDVKPANLFIVEQDGSKRVKVLDFGVAKMMSENTHIKAALAKTGLNVTSFTPQYGAPEQFNRRYGATGPWTDVYALALVGVELLTGHEALDGDDVVQLAVSTGNPEFRPTPRALGADISDSVEAVFQRALSVNPGDRYARAGEFWQALKGAAEGVASATLAHSLPPSTHAAFAPTAVMPTGPDAASTIQAASRAIRPSTGGARGPVIGGVLAAGVALVGAGYFIVSSDLNRGGSPVSSALAVSAPASASASAVAAPPPPSCPERMALIPKGQFFMGSDSESARDNEKPSHNVTLAPFCIDLYEVTAEQYKACSDVGRCKRARAEVTWPGMKEADAKLYAQVCTIDDPQRAQHPINCVDWDMANTYCRAQSKRLPTEAEWEYATRGPDGRVYPWGDEAPGVEHLNACGSECMAWAKKQGVSDQFPGALYEADDGFPTTAPVGKFEKGKSRFGPYDVVGNVWEWVADWEGEYRNEPRVNPTGPESGQKRVIRGGAFNGSFASWLRPSFRYAQVPQAKSHGIGFRCARALDAGE